MSIKKGLNLLEHLSISLPAERAENDAVDLGLLCFFDLLGPNQTHLLRLVHLVRQLLFKWVILKETKMRVADHARFNVESAISDEDNAAGLLRLIATDCRTGATQDLSRGSRSLHGNGHISKAFLRCHEVLQTHESSVELHDAKQVDFLILLKVESDRLQ